MPAHITHSLFGAAVLSSGISEPLNEGDSVCGYALDRTAFEWGLQGPDLLFFAILAGNKKLPHCGNVMHGQEIDRLFIALQQYAVSVKNTKGYKAVYSYILGFCCHYVLDKNCHPFVYYWQNEAERQCPRLHCVHNKLESDIDSAMCERRLHNSVRAFRMPDAIMKDNSVCRPISKLYAFLFTELYDIPLSIDEVLLCFVGARRYFRFIIDRGGLRFLAKAVDFVTRKKGAVYHMLRVKGYDSTAMNDDHRQWVNLTRPEVKRTESFEQLFDGSVGEAAELIGRMASYILNQTPTQVTFGDSFDNGTMKP